MACQASLMVNGALASYDIPPQHRGSRAHARHAEPDSSMPAWLADCISEAAKYLDQAPFLQLLLPTHARAGDCAFQRHRVTTAVVQVCLWSHCPGSPLKPVLAQQGCVHLEAM